MSEHLAYLTRSDNRLELVYPEYGLRLRAAYAEWLFEAASEIIRRLEHTKTQGSIDELEMLQEFGEDESAGVNMDILKYESGTRFGTVPQCLVTLGDADYRWVAREARPIDQNSIGERLHDTLMTRPIPGAD